MQGKGVLSVTLEGQGGDWCDVHSIVRTSHHASIKKPSSALGVLARTTPDQWFLVDEPVLGLPAVCPPHGSESVIQGRETFPLTNCAGGWLLYIWWDEGRVAPSEQHILIRQLSS